MSPQNPPSGTPRLRRALAVGAALTLVAAGCGGDDDVEDAVDQAASDAAAELSDVSEEDLEAAADDVDEAADDAADAAEEEADELADVLRENGLESIAAAVAVIDFDEIVDVDDFTFLAPNDEAFTSLSADELTDLLADPGRVGDILRNHTFAQRLTAADLSDGMELETEAGATLTVSIVGDTVMIGDATVVTTDIDVNDGVIHVVDTLIMP